MKTAKERFAGANTLALAADDFERGYPSLAEATKRYASFEKSKARRARLVLAMKLFLRGVEDPRSLALRNFLSNPEDCSGGRGGLGDVLLAALNANYLRLKASGFYSDAAALQHGRKAIEIFRWLATDSKIYPALPARVPLRPSNRKGARKDRNVEVPFLPMPVEQIRSILGEVFYNDLLGYQTVTPRGVRKVVGPRYLMSYITTRPSGHSDAFIAAFSGKPGVVCDSSAVKALFEECEEALLRSRAFSVTTISGWMRDCTYLFEYLSELPGRTYTHFSRSYTKFTHVPAESATLADLDFPETRRLDGAAKLRASLELISEAALDVVRKHANFFETAAAVREGRISTSDTENRRAACAAISTVVRAEIISLEKTGRSQFSRYGAPTDVENVGQAMQLLADPVTWREAGLGELVPEASTLDFAQIMYLVVACIGATHQVALAAKIVFCCESGWNRQPIEDIPPEIYQFRLADRAGVASASFVAVFKNRAGHLVQTLLEHSELTGGRATDAMAGWEDAEREHVWAEFDQRCMLSYTSPAYVALELIRPLVESVDAFTKDEKVHKRFFKCLSYYSGVSVAKRDIATVFKIGVLSTPGLHFKLIRKTYLQMMLRVVGSVESLRAHAGHSGTGVLLPHYLNSAAVRRELEQSTRFFHNAVQALVVAEVGPPLRFLMSDENHEWFYNLARASGVASAVGYGVSTPLAGPPAFDFTPSDQQVRALCAIKMSLDAEEPTADLRRWALAGVPLRGFIQALLSKLNAAGMSGLVRRVSDELETDVNLGKVILPNLNLSRAPQ